MTRIKEVASRSNIINQLINFSIKLNNIENK